MTLSDVLKEFPEIRISNPKCIHDNQKILEFYNQIQMNSSEFNIKFDRGDLYFRFLNFQSSKYYTFILENDDHKIEGISAMVFFPFILDGQKVEIGYLGDLRIKKNRTSKTQWKDVFHRVIGNAQNIEEIHHCPFFIASIIDSNNQAIKSMMDPKLPYSFHPVWNYQMTSLVAPKPIISRLLNPRDNFNINPCSLDDIELKSFFDNSNHQKKFSQLLDSKELKRRELNWDNYQGLYTVKDSDTGQILATFSPWSSSSGRKIIVDRVPKKLKKASTFLKLFGVHLPKEGEEMKILYITHLVFNQSIPQTQYSLIINAIVNFIKENKMDKNQDFIAFAEDRSEKSPGILSQILEKRYFIQKTPTTLYQVLPQGELKQLLPKGQKPYFEMALA